MGPCDTGASRLETTGSALVREGCRAIIYSEYRTVVAAVGGVTVSGAAGYGVGPGGFGRRER